MEYVITFKNTNHAIKAEKYLLEQNLNITVMPLPSKIRAGCGICLRVIPEEIESARSILAGKGIGETGVFLKQEMNGVVTFMEREFGNDNN